MDREQIAAQMAEVVALHGPWGANNLALPFGLYTIDAQPRGDNFRTVKFLQIVADTLRKPLKDIRVLDLGSGEGLYSLEFGQHGAEVVGVEGRLASVAKADFCKRVLGLDRVRFVHGDVRQITAGQYGAFDLIICSGILYHLSDPDAFALLKTMRSMCSGICVIDTRISLTGDVEAAFEGETYRGSHYREHAPGATPEQKLADMGASLDNDQSFWLTRYDLVNLLMDLGFTSVMECLAPVPFKLRRSRTTLIATAGQKVCARNEIGHDLASRRWPPLWDTDTADGRAHPDEAA